MSFISLNGVFKKICFKVIDPKIAPMLKLKCVETIFTLEKVFPPACFDVMTHLVMHLVEEFDLCGSVQTRWMYRMEKYMKALKGFVRNMA